MARPVDHGAGTTGASLLPTVGPLPALSRRALAGAILGLAVLAHLLLASGLPPLARGLSALLLTALLPGWLLVEWLVGTSEAPPDPWERVLYATGTGYALMVLVMLALSYLPGGLARWQTLAAFDLLLLALLLLVARRWNARPTIVTLHPST
ncbi:MAG TPA: hypothetical protein VER55_14040, partial [Ardenticatenaceae bacterium]|nr:hypothetical protein [Ardenticatenaceae bacterium]